MPKRPRTTRRFPCTPAIRFASPRPMERIPCSIAAPRLSVIQFDNFCQDRDRRIDLSPSTKYVLWRDRARLLRISNANGFLGQRSRLRRSMGSAHRPCRLVAVTRPDALGLDRSVGLDLD